MKSFIPPDSEHVYYLLEKEGIKPPSHQVEAFPLKEELKNYCQYTSTVEPHYLKLTREK